MVAVVVAETEQLRGERREHWATGFGTPPDCGRRGRAVRLLPWETLRGGEAEAASRPSSSSHRRKLALIRETRTWEAPRDQPEQVCVRGKKVLPWVTTLNGSLGTDVRSAGE